MVKESAKTKFFMPKGMLKSFKGICDRVGYKYSAAVIFLMSKLVESRDFTISREVLADNADLSYLPVQLPMEMVKVIDAQVNNRSALFREAFNRYAGELAQMQASEQKIVYRVGFVTQGIYDTIKSSANKYKGNDLIRQVVDAFLLDGLTEPITPYPRDVRKKIGLYNGQMKELDRLVAELPKVNWHDLVCFAFEKYYKEVNKMKTIQ